MTTTTKSTMSAAELEHIIGAAVAAAIASTTGSAAPPALKEPETAPKGRKGGKKKAAPKGRTICQANMAAFRRDTGTKFRKAYRVAEAVKAGKLQRSALRKAGWDFGPGYAGFLDAKGVKTVEEYFAS